MTRVVLYGSPVADRADRLAAELGPEFEIVTVGYRAEDREKAAAVSGAAVVVAVRYDLDLPETGSLRLVQVPGVGCDEIDVDLLPAGAMLCNVRGHEAGVAEYVVLQLLEWCQRSRDATDGLRSGSWRRSSRFGAAPHRELGGATVGIVGYGGIGQTLAPLLRTFGTRVLVANRTPPPAGDVDGSFDLDGIGRMFASCDFGVVAIALGDTTRGMVTARELRALGPEGVIVNVARAAVVDEDDLWSCLTDGSLGGAILDVWYRYPDAVESLASPSRHPLLTLDNVVGTPHMAGWTEGTVERRWREIAENIRRIARDGRPLNVVRDAINGG